MKIGIDAHMFQSSNKTGIPIAVENVLRSWSIHHPEHEYYLFARKDIHLDIQWGKNWHRVDTPELDKTLSRKSAFISKCFGASYRFLIFPYQLHAYDLDVFWGPCYFLPPKMNPKTKYVVSIYDLAMFRFKDTVLFYKRMIHEIGLPLSSRIADKIITISRASAEDIHELLNVRKNKIFISYLGGLNQKSKAEKTEFTSDMKPELNIKGQFLLFISTIEPRKNIMTIIRAFEQYLDRYQDKDLYLVLAGGKGWKCEDIYAAAENSRYRSRIIMPGYISNEEKSYLLDHATAFVYPSLYEGFGIPILEAFDKGLPVITTNISSMPEVGGDAAFYIQSPYHTNELVHQMRKVLTLSDAEKAAVQARIRRQLRKFNWDKNADEILRMFRRLCDEEPA